MRAQIITAYNMFYLQLFVTTNFSLAKDLITNLLKASREDRICVILLQDSKMTRRVKALMATPFIGWKRSVEKVVVDWIADNRSRVRESDIFKPPSQSAGLID